MLGFGIIHREITGIGEIMAQTIRWILEHATNEYRATKNLNPAVRTVLGLIQPLNQDGLTEEAVYDRLHTQIRELLDFEDAFRQRVLKERRRDQSDRPKNLKR